MTSTVNRAVFLSYASQDADAARRICETLRAAGVEVWFDQSELRGGDAWDAKIRKQIKDCALFIPLISANTQARHEGYFRLEWHLAEQRSHLIARGRPFIVPVAVDDTGDAEALVPDAFLAVQWIRLPRGEATAEFGERIQALLAGDAAPARVSHERVADGAAGSTALHGGAPAPAPPMVKRRSRLTVVTFGCLGGLAIVVVGLILIVAFRPRRSPKDAAKLIAASESLWKTIGNTTGVGDKVDAQQLEQVMKLAQSASTPAPAPSPARELIARAQAILDRGSLTRAQLDAAGELCDRALQLDPTDALVWATAANADLLLIYPYGYDRSDERRRRAQDRAAHAVSLAPDLFEVRHTQAVVYAHAVGTPALLTEAEKTLRALIAEHPNDQKLVLDLAEVLREEKHFDDAARLFESAGEFEVAAWSYYDGGELQPALAAITRARRSVTAVELKALLQLEEGEDPDAAQATIDQLNPSELLAEMPAAVALRVALYRRDSARLLELAQGLSTEYLESNAFQGPRRFFTGLAHELAGRNGPAEVEWRAALAEVQARLKVAPDDRNLVLWAAYFNAALGHREEAERLFARSQTLAGLSGHTMDPANELTLQRLHAKEPLLAGVEALLRLRAVHWERVHVEMRYSPLYDFLRGDPTFEKLLRDNLPPGAKPFPPQKTETKL